MKKIMTAAVIMITASVMQAQKTEGRVTYERTSQVQVVINDNGHSGMAQSMPRTRTDRFELLFGNNKSIWRAAEQDNEQDNMASSEGGMQVRIMVSGADDVVFSDFNTKERIEKREMLEKTFIINDSIRPLKWKVTGESKTILGFPCVKATSSDIRVRTMTSMDNGKIERKEVPDTITIAAWFTSEFAVPAGPAEYQGQLPGLILEVDINNGRQTFKALQVSSTTDLAQIKAPTGKKQYTPDEYRKERDKMLEEMQRNNQGGNRVIRMQ